MEELDRVMFKEKIFIFNIFGEVLIGEKKA